MSRRLALAAAFVACVWGANWAISTFDPIELPLLGWAAPAGVLFAGLTFGVRDALHDAGGHRWVLPAVVVGAALSWHLTDAVTLPGGHVTLAVASGVAFGASELADWLIYTPLRRNHWVSGVFASNLVGAVADSLLFLWLAFGTVDLVGGQVAWKLVMVLPALPVVWVNRRQRRTTQAAADFVLDRTENPHPLMLAGAMTARRNAIEHGGRMADYWRGYLHAMCDATGELDDDIEAWMDRNA